VGSALGGLCIRCLTTMSQRHRFLGPGIHGSPATPECWRGQIRSKAYQGTLLTFGNNCFEGGKTFGLRRLWRGAYDVSAETSFLGSGCRVSDSWYRFRTIVSMCLQRHRIEPSSNRFSEIDGPICEACCVDPGPCRGTSIIRKRPPPWTFIGP